MLKKTLRDVDLGGRRVLMRVDFNVPLSADGDVSDDTRIRAALPSIEYAAARGASIVLMSHLGRPKGVKKSSLSLKIIAYHLGEMTKYPVKFVGDCIGEEVDEKVKSLKAGEILLLENIRFYEEETKNDPDFAFKLSKYGDIYVNDAFGTAHRAHASTEGVTHYFKDKVAGFLMEKELTTLDRLIADPARPFVAILGGAKVSSKIGLIRNLLDKVDRIIIGGGMAFTFFKAAGLEIGDSLLDEDYVDMCREIMEKSGKGASKQIFLPVDCVVADHVSNNADHKTVSTGGIPEGWTGVDIGDSTISIFTEEILGAGTVFWNGPMGVFEIPDFSNGTRMIARAIVEATAKGVVSVIGGGDSAAALNQLGLAGKVSHLSTGGGASLEFLEGKILPGVVPLDDKTGEIGSGKMEKRGEHA
ncbi:MAG: phosphoglycerate kinase [Candidatus Krumholzibacteriota bacterium]|nr:phosphoglycerate kinase [Candidatus Krumholzibacteriota bacterium]